MMDEPFGSHSLRIDPDAEVERARATLTDYLARTKRRGVVVALSGGIDSSVVAALSVAALGADYAQGYLLGRPNETARGLAPEAAGFWAPASG